MSIRIVLFLSVAALIHAPAFAQNPGPASPDEPTPASAPVVSATTTSLACYFSKADHSVRSTWQWGLSPGNQWYQLTGSWETTPYTKLTKFFTDKPTAELNEACKRSKNYYKLHGYDMFAYFAADSNIGYNYPIVSGGVELFPAVLNSFRSFELQRRVTPLEERTGCHHRAFAPP